jgi:hypothetical protein
METYTSITYSVHKKNDQSITKVEYNSTIKDKDKLVNTYYNNNISEDSQNESFTKTLKDKQNTYEQVGISINKADWNIKEYHNNNCNKQYIDGYNMHNFDKCITDFIPSLTSLNENEKLFIENN